MWVRFLPRAQQMGDTITSMDEQVLEEMYRLTKENNRMLHAMRRNAFWGGLFKLLIYAALVIVPLWYYQQYLAPTVEQAMQSIQQMRTTGQQAQAQLTGFQQTIQELESKLPAGILPGTTKTQ